MVLLKQIELMRFGLNGFVEADRADEVGTQWFVEADRDSMVLLRLVVLRLC